MDSSAMPAASVSVVIALGGNIGDRMANFHQGLNLLREAGVMIARHGCLYESAPKYVTDQPFFLNSAIEATTTLSPSALLSLLKSIESRLGRDLHGLRNGPRPLDLDIIFYGTHTLLTDLLHIPHPRMAERPFVLAPVADLLCQERTGGVAGVDEEVREGHWSQHPACRGAELSQWVGAGGQPMRDGFDQKRVLALGGGRMWAWENHPPEVMGILNITPDSFSDGGSFLPPHDAVSAAMRMVEEGAFIVDVGGQSTRPGANPVSPIEEMSRVLPVIEALAKSGVLISIDTFSAVVAESAVNSGAHIVNDVSGGTLDSAMIATVAGLNVPYVSMHMRGDPKCMQDDRHLLYRDVCREVGEEIGAHVKMGEALGLPVWRVITDPGLGFSKSIDQNVELMRDLPRFRTSLRAYSNALCHMPVLIGPSRKGFLGKITGRKLAADRDWATCAAVVACAVGGANIIRTHNVAAVRDAVKIATAVWRR